MKDQNNNLQVMKFGGTSVGDASCMRRTAEIIAHGARNGRVVVVTSAMSGVTNRLLAAAQAAVAGDEDAGAALAEVLREGHFSVSQELLADTARRTEIETELDTIIADIANLCRGTALLRELTPRVADAITGAGERLAVRLLTGAVQEMGVAGVAVEATDCIVTDARHGGAEPLPGPTRTKATARLRPMLENKQVPIVTGFIGASEAGVLTTLGRGGSDYSATILGQALDATEVIIWTDVDGVMTCDPRLVPSARIMREISYKEAGELAFFGAKVLHPKTLRPVVEAAIPVWIRNSFRPEVAGTKITQTGHPAAQGVKALTAMANVSLITLGGPGIVGAIGVAAKTFTAAAQVRANVLFISQASSENDICFIVETADAEKTVAALRDAFADDLAHHAVEHIQVNNDIAIVAAVGEKMHGMTGVAGRVFSALGREGINIIAIAQGSSEYNVSFVVERSALRSSVTILHQEFTLHEAK
jgi:aspartate kinase